jgi:hypothetical protein
MRIGKGACLVVGGNRMRARSHFLGVCFLRQEEIVSAPLVASWFYFHITEKKGKKPPTTCRRPYLKTCPPNPLQKKRRKGRSVFSVKFHMRDTKCKKKKRRSCFFCGYRLTLGRMTHPSLTQTLCYTLDNLQTLF